MTIFFYFLFFFFFQIFGGQPVLGELVFSCLFLFSCSGVLGLYRRPTGLVGQRFAHQRFADSRESIRKKKPIFEALGQIRANRVFSPIRIEIRVIRVQSLPLSHFFEGRFAKRRFFRSENRFAENIARESRIAIRANRPTKLTESQFWGYRVYKNLFNEKRVYPYPLGAGSARPNPKMGAPDPENPYFSVFSGPNPEWGIFRIFSVFFRIFPVLRGFPCPSFPCFFGKRQGKPPKKQGFFIPTEPLISLEKKGKTLEKTRNSSQGEKTRNSKKKTRKGRTGLVFFQF